MNEFNDSLLRYAGTHSGDLKPIQELDVDIIGAVILMDDNRVVSVTNTLIDMGLDVDKDDIVNHIEESDYLFMTKMFSDNEIFLPRYRGDDLWRPVFPRKAYCEQCEDKVDVGEKMSVGVCMSCVKKRAVIEGL